MKFKKINCSKCNVMPRTKYHSWCTSCHQAATNSAKSPFVYKLVNSVNDKVQYGATKKPAPQRLYGYRNVAKDSKQLAHNSPIHTAIRDIGPENFKIEILCYCETKAEANLIEHFLIAQARERGEPIYNSLKATR